MAKRKLTKRADGRYQSQIYLGTDENGKRIIKTLYGRTQKELEEKECLLKVKPSRGFDIKAERKTFGEWAELFLRMKESKNVSAGRLANYGYALMKFEPLYQYPLEKLYPIDFQRIIDSWAKENPNTGKPSSKALLTEMKRAANGVYRMAISNRVVEFNPIADVEISAIQKKEPKRILTEEEQRWIREMPHRAQAAAMIMLYAGLRRGELVPLMWNDIDFAAGTISITKTVECINGKFILKDGAKSENSVRTITMPHILKNFLLEEKQKKVVSLYVVPDAKGCMMSENSFRRMWQSYMTQLNFRYGDFSAYGSRTSVHDPKGVPMVIEGFTAHQLRHTYASILYMAGVDVVTAKELMGHADIQTTLEIYTHLSKTYKKKEVSKLDEYLANAE